MNDWFFKDAFTEQDIQAIQVTVNTSRQTIIDFAKLVARAFPYRSWQCVMHSIRCVVDAHIAPTTPTTEQITAIAKELDGLFRKNGRLPGPYHRKAFYETRVTYTTDIRKQVLTTDRGREKRRYRNIQGVRNAREAGSIRKPASRNRSTKKK